MEVSDEFSFCSPTPMNEKSRCVNMVYSLRVRIRNYLRTYRALCEWELEQDGRAIVAARESRVIISLNHRYFLFFITIVTNNDAFTFYPILNHRDSMKLMHCYCCNCITFT